MLHSESGSYYESTVIVWMEYAACAHRRTAPTPPAGGRRGAERLVTYPVFEYDCRQVA